MVWIITSRGDIRGVTILKSDMLFLLFSF